MSNTARKIVLVLVILNLIFIWGNSLIPGELSGVESGMVKDMLDDSLSYIKSGRIQRTLTRIADRTSNEPLRRILYWSADFLQVHVFSHERSYLVRKTAHFLEFAFLGMLMGLLLSRQDGRGRFWWPEVMCLCVAAIDETIQLFVAGRSAMIADVVLDLAGGTVGVIFTLLLLGVIYAFKKRKIGKNMQ